MMGTLPFAARGHTGGPGGISDPSGSYGIPDSGSPPIARKPLQQ